MSLRRAISGAAVVGLVSALLLSGCSRNRQEAIILANQGDQVVDLDPNGAIEKYEMATQLDPSNHRIFHKLAVAYQKKEQWDKVAQTLARATDIAPERANYWFLRGHALFQQAKKKAISYDDCKESFKRCIEADPNYYNNDGFNCHYFLAIAELWTDREQEALINYTKSIEFRPVQLKTYTRLADLYQRLGYDKEAEQVLDAAKEMADPSKHKKELFNVHTLYGRLYRDREETQKMVDAFEAAKAVNPEDAGSLFNIGMGYAKLNPPKKEQAKDMLKGFMARACKAKKKTYEAQCKQATAIVAKFTRVGG